MATCSYCKGVPASYACGNACGTMYCSEECASNDWNLQKHFEPCIGKKAASGISKKKAREILHHGSVHGHPLTEKQRRYFGWIANQ